MIKKKFIKILLLTTIFFIYEYEIYFPFYNFYLIKKKKIKIAIFARSIKNGGVEKQTALMLNHFIKVNILDLYLFTLKNKEKNEYKIDRNIKRKIIKNNLIQILIENEIDILIYQFYNVKEIEQLNKITKIKTIVINHSCFLHWIYYKKYFFFTSVYKAYRHCKYLISLVPFENNYLFKKWGIKSILMNNFISYEYNYIIPSDLSSKTILMVGRGDDPIKRFELGIKAMKYIINKIPECKMKIISKTSNIKNLINLVKILNLNSTIEFVGYRYEPSIYYKNASLHIFPTLVEAFPNVLSETLIYGIPNILTGLDYVSTSKGGTIIIYDDSPISIAKVAIKILINKRYRKKLGKEARNKMKKFRNDILLKKWIKIILDIYKEGSFYEELKNNDNKYIKNESLKIIENQIKLLKIRNKIFKKIRINNIENITFMENIEEYIK